MKQLGRSTQHNIRNTRSLIRIFKYTSKISPQKEEPLHTHTNTYTPTRTHIHTHPHTHTYTYRERHIQTHTHTHTQRGTHARTYTLYYIYAQTIFVYTSRPRYGGLYVTYIDHLL